MCLVCTRHISPHDTRMHHVMSYEFVMCVIYISIHSPGQHLSKKTHPGGHKHADFIAQPGSAHREKRHFETTEQPGCGIERMAARALPALPPGAEVSRDPQGPR